MTSLGETNRHNLVTEGIEREKLNISWNTLAENVRHNIAEEGLKYDTLRETIRNNKIMNKYYLGSLAEAEAHNRNVELHDLEELAEAIRHNLAVEKETWRNHTATEAEIAAHNQAEEWLKQLDIAVNAWKGNGGKVSTSSGGGGKSGKIVSDIISGPYLDLLKGLAPGALSSATGGIAYAISSQQDFNVRGKYKPAGNQGVEPTYQRVSLDYLDRDVSADRNEMPVDYSQSRGPSYSNVPISDVTGKTDRNVQVASSSHVASASNVPISHYKTSTPSNAKGNYVSTGSIITKSTTSNAKGGPGYTSSERNAALGKGGPTSSTGGATAREHLKSAYGLGGPSSSTGGPGYSGGGNGGGVR